MTDTDDPLSRGPVAVLGTGAVGAYYGGRLAAGGLDVHFHARSDAEALRTHGLHVQSTDGDFALAHPNVYDDPATMPAASVILVTLKATARADYERLIRPLLRPDTVVICLQNGLGNEEAFATVVGDDRVFGAVAFTCINRVEPGRIVHSAEGTVRLGAFGRASPAVARQLGDAMRRCGIDARVVPDLHAVRWQKLLWNIPFNGWGAALDRDSGQMLATPDGERLVRDTMLEVIAAAASVGVTLDPAVIDDQIARTRRMGAYHSSMQLDRQAGRAMEVDAVVAEPLRRARAAGCRALPLIEAMRRTLRVFAPE